MRGQLSLEALLLVGVAIAALTVMLPASRALHEAAAAAIRAENGAALLATLAAACDRALLGTAEETLRFTAAGTYEVAAAGGRAALQLTTPRGGKTLEVRFGCSLAGRLRAGENRIRAAPGQPPSVTLNPEP